MSEPVILISGKIGSGKSTVSRLLSESLGCLEYGFGDYVRKIVADRGMVESRANLQTVGEELVAGGIEQFCNAVLAEAGWQTGKCVVVHGLRHQAVRNKIAVVIAPQAVRHFHLSPPESARQSRLDEGDRSMLVDSHSTEVEVSTSLQTTADLVLQQRDSRSAVEQILAWLRLEHSGS